jgi:S-DNA-T family DNA segregation ATPase FtsK/SpoIIIE
VKSLLPFLSIDRKREIVGILLCTLGVLVLVSLATHRATDDLWFTDDLPQAIAPEVLLSNQGGVVGAAVSYMLLNLFGFAALFVPLWLGGKGWALLAHRSMASYLRSIWLIFLAVYILGVIFGMPGAGRGDPMYDPGSTLGGFVAHWTSLGLVTLFGSLGGIIVALGILAVVIAMLISWRPQTISWLHPSRWLTTLRSAATFLSDVGPSRRDKSSAAESDGPSMRERAAAFWEGVQVLFGTRELADAVEPQPRSTQRVRLVKPEPESVPSPAASYPEDELPLGMDEGPLPAIKPASAPRNRVDTTPIPAVTTGHYQFPSLSTLEAPAGLQHSVSRTELETTTTALQQTLETFGVGVDGPIRQFPGPVITRFEFKPAAGIKVNQVLGLADDLALALSAKRIRIIAPIPGKPAVGIEIPNREPQLVYLSEIINSDEFARPEWRLPLALGKTTSGQPYVADLARMPHLLIAGATGSGKSVCINAVITSLIYRLPPEFVRFLFIDPKMLELPVYDGIPHMERPVVTKAKQAEKMLVGAVGEMEDRYARLAQAGVRNIEDFNRKSTDDPLPYIVIVVDELADLMMSAESNRIETTIARLAQMARAVGIHLILATQRPSVDVITGVIKANFSSRIAFQVASKIDSRTIIDANGAEKLLGKGDMLFLLTGEPEPVRLHGALVTSQETEAIVEHLRNQSAEAAPIEHFAAADSEEETVTGTALEGYSDDPLFREAAEVVIKSKMGSVSLLQRRLGIGYQRAGRLVDQLERAGVVGPHDGSRAREVLVDLSFLETKVEA